MTLAHIDQRNNYAPVVSHDNHWIELMQPAAELAGQIAATDFVPAEFRNKPAAIAACILFGAELGLGPMVSLSKIDIVKGRPAPRAEIGRALALAAGHEIWTEEATNTRVTVNGRRRGSSNIETVTWSMDDVKKAGIGNNPTYSKYPRQMLHARASAELVRRMCPEVLGGITMFAEEAGDVDDGPVEITAPDKPKATNTRKRRDPAPVAEVEAGTEEATTEPPADAPSAAQTKMAMASFNEIGVTERDDRLAATSAFIGRQVGSWSELTKSEASTVIDGLEHVKSGDASFAISDDGSWSIAMADRDQLDLD